MPLDDDEDPPPFIKDVHPSTMRARAPRPRRVNRTWPRDFRATVMFV
jgi:hypothetical protein